MFLPAPSVTIAQWKEVRAVTSNNEQMRYTYRRVGTNGRKSGAKRGFSKSQVGCGAHEVGCDGCK